MCGRYYVDDETAREIEKLAGAAEGKMGNSADLCPNQKAPVLLAGRNHMELRKMQWGFIPFDGKGLLINARAESVSHKIAFGDSIRNRRCIIPARGFYEWNSSREKFFYERPDGAVLFMAGCYKNFQGRTRFVILTTRANASVMAVHSRMPLILEQQELEVWLRDDQAMEYLLRKVPGPLRQGTEYHQMSLFGEKAPGKEGGDLIK